MSLFERLLGKNKAAQPSLPAIDLNSTNPVNVLLALDPRKDRKRQMADLIDATKDTAALELPGFAYLPEPEISQLGDYAVVATVYDKKEGIPLAYVDLDEKKGIVYITLKGDSRKHVGDLQKRLSDLGVKRPEILY